MSKNLGKKILDAGGKVIEILSSNGGGATNRMQLDSWITTFNLNISSFIDAPGMPTAALQAAGIRETVFIVELSTMKILYVNHGDVTGIAAPSVDVATDMILALLK